ncbi:Type II secretory pathway ATPase GspE/PulE or T4P pilus assembly pathway ATPase PilB [Formivibrio citricus]|uniref:Type II secretory pathway ATPase GspE/PulE or T4P pilus assembly pathway ATPase PilB n=1 Tax=Formivibrio citricus TaxID=83765 RepID=A0A1I4XUU9_9NEIS|nr:GspE/PulE family protein [Formivibrio citricus]SFN29059.1 Type II secretory pathway ATPase GspE/PulE or T4P pilus assembly pathway ATPase PilB [Formivibrio citricus]
MTSHAEKNLNFLRDLQALTNRIHATARLDELLTELSDDICAVFNAERLTIYVVGEDGRQLVSRVKTGLEGLKELRLPVDDRSIAGFVANHKQVLNLLDVYDAQELQRYAPTLQFLQAVDRQTGFRSREMLVAPVMNETDGTLVGVVQIINNHAGQAFDAMMVDGIKLLTKTLAIALKQRQQGGVAFVPQHKYHALIGSGTLTPAAWQVAVKESQKTGRDIETVLTESFGISLERIGASLSAFYGVPYEPFKPDRIKPHDLLKNLKLEFVKEKLWVPVDEDKDGLVIVAADPEKVRGNLYAVSQLFPGRKISVRVATLHDFRQLLDQFFGAADAGNIDTLLSSMDEGEEEVSSITAEDISAAQDNELVKLVNQIIVDAHRMGASDIHIEPYPGAEKVRIRFRRDGNLMNYREVPASWRNPLVARIKIMCDLDISERRKPQDGKIKMKKFVPNLDIELRVATVPTAGGLEDVVMRILAAGEPLPLEKLALSDFNLVNLKKVVDKPYGLFFVCGPTGSGKTTTLHSVLKYLNKPETKIWTAEDPVEITQKGLRQVQVNPKAGLTFASIMRAFLRADPDIIMVGEMRDAETAGTGIEASLTGHLVLATLHTNSAPESVIRLLDMGMDPFNFSDALLGILAQRLARRLCDCKEACMASEDELKQMLAEYSEELRNTTAWKQNPQAEMARLYQQWLQRYGKDGQITLYRAKGCDKCGNTGYKGRVGLHELLVGTDPVKALIQEKARVAQILACALEEGMRTLKQDGVEKVLAGVTDMAQVRAVCIK